MPLPMIICCSLWRGKLHLTSRAESVHPPVGHGEAMPIRAVILRVAIIAHHSMCYRLARPRQLSLKHHIDDGRAAARLRVNQRHGTLASPAAHRGAHTGRERPAGRDRLGRAHEKRPVPIEIRRIRPRLWCRRRARIGRHAIEQQAEAEL